MNATHNQSPNDDWGNRAVCATCGLSFDMSASVAPPFCSERCQMVDLGRWLGEEIRIPQESQRDVDMDLGD